jgi:hypothetical protein
VLAEQKRRGKEFRVSDENSRKRKVETISVPLTQGKLNAVRAAFKAGVTPSRIARQFGISQSDARRVPSCSCRRERCVMPEVSSRPGRVKEFISDN